MSASVSVFSEYHVEQAALTWFKSAGWAVRHGAEIAPGEPAAERASDNNNNNKQVVLERRLREVLNDFLHWLARPACTGAPA